MRRSGLTGRLWLSSQAWDLMQREADDGFPDETGGILFGYWIRRFDEAVVSEVIGPGPNAQHRADSFRPDADYQERELELFYEEYGRLHTYLGDWHTHPVGPASLSKLDRGTLRRIARHKDARAPVPIMVVMARPDDWLLRAWRRPRGWVRNRWPLYPEFEVLFYKAAR